MKTIHTSFYKWKSGSKIFSNENQIPKISYKIFTSGNQTQIFRENKFQKLVIKFLQVGIRNKKFYKWNSGLIFCMWKWDTKTTNENYLTNKNQHENSIQ
jgi:hypothetical protein